MPNPDASEPTKNLKVFPSTNYGLVPLNADGSIDVNSKTTQTMDVNIQSCSSRSFYLAEPIEL